MRLTIASHCDDYHAPDCLLLWALVLTASMVSVRDSIIGREIIGKEEVT